MRRDYLNVHVFEGRDWYSPESDRWLFFSSFVGGPFRRKNFKRKKIWGYGVKFWKKKQALYVEFNEEVEAATNSY